VQLINKSARLFIEERASRVLYWTVLITAVAIVVHVSSLLLIPRFASQDAYIRLTRKSPETRVSLINADSQIFTRSDPNVVVGACPYRLADGPLRVRTKPEAQEFLSIAFHAPDGTAFFAVTDKAATKNELNILLVTQQQLRAIESEDDPEEPVPELRLVAASNDGFVVIRSLVQRPGERVAAEQRIMSIVCEIDKSEMPEN